MIFFKETDFQDSPVGKIPKEWEFARLDEVLSLEYGEGLPERDRVRGAYPVVGSNGIVGYHNRALIKGPGIVVGRKGTIGAVSWIDSDFWPIDTTYHVQTLRSDIFLRWLFVELSYLNLGKLSLADVVPGLKRELVYSLKIPIPPISEQRAIVEVLSAVDSAAGKVDEVISRTERLKKALMRELLTKGIGHKEFKDTEIGRIPKEWKVLKVADILSLEYGSGLPERERISGIYPVVGSNGIVGYHNRAIVKGPGIVVGRKGTIGAVTWVNQDFWPIDTTYYVKTRTTDISLKWLFYELIHLNPTRFHLADVVPGLKRELVHSLRMALPSFHEQERIASTLSTVDKKLELERNEKARLERIKQGLMDLLLTGKVRVKVKA